jgi:membrane associated rhomboid family serine protease
MFGRILENVWGAKRFLFFYLACGIGAAAAHLIMQYIMGGYSFAVGASGAVSAVLFAAILFFPTENIYLYGIIPIPSVIAGVLYLGYSYYMARRGMDNIGHDAHFWGAIWGLVFTSMLDLRILELFILQLTTPALWGFGAN